MNRIYIPKSNDILDEQYFELKTKVETLETVYNKFKLWRESGAFSEIQNDKLLEFELSLHHDYLISAKANLNRFILIHGVNTNS